MTRSPVTVSQTLTQRSFPADATNFEQGDIATAFTHEECALISTIIERQVPSSTKTFPACDPAATSDIKVRSKTRGDERQI